MYFKWPQVGNEDSKRKLNLYMGQIIWRSRGKEIKERLGEIKLIVI